MRHDPLLPDHLLPVVLVGLPGSGKTTVSRELARLINVVEVDTDAEVRRRTRLSITELFAREGEAGFRKREHEAIAHALAHSNGVVALGGGSILHAGTRGLLANHMVVHLATTPREAARRVGSGAGRPLLEVDPLGRMEQLAAERDALYDEVATITVPTDGINPTEVAIRAFESLRRWAKRNPHRPTTARLDDTGCYSVHVKGEQPYEVVIGRGIADRIVAAVPERAGRALLLHPAVMAEAADNLAADLRAIGKKVFPVELPDAEEQKTVEVAAHCFDQAGKARISREDVVIGLGGGATTDLAGWVAASWLRGIKVIQVPTTLLGMVDAVVGGKTGINTSYGKNLVGAFWPPHQVICDLEFLQTLPAEDLTGGLGEVIKCGFIADSKILDLVASQRGQAVHDPSSRVIDELVLRSVAVKADVVSADLREAGLREILNYGHTFGHAIEVTENYEMRHGEAVAIGMVFAAELAGELGLIDRELVERHRSVLQAVGLPIHYDGAPWEVLVDHMYSDKKVRSSQLRMVLLEGLAKPSTHRVADAGLLHRVAERLRTP